MKVHVVDLKSESIASPISVRAYLNQMITEFKQLIAQVSHSSLFFFLLQLLVSSSTISCVDIIHGNVGFFLQSIKLTHVVRFPPRQQGCRPKPCVWSWSAAITTFGFCMFQTRH